MREILGRRRRNRGVWRETALTCAVGWNWPVVPGVGLRPGGGCACGQPPCRTPGVHPGDPELLAATTDARMVRWWWTRRPDAPPLVATGGRAPCALTLPTPVGRRALAELDRWGVQAGPVIATRTRLALLVAPYELSELGDALCTLLETGPGDGGPAALPASLRFHGDGGFLPLPPTAAGRAVPGGSGAVWVRRPGARPEPPLLPGAMTVLRVLATLDRSVPGTGSRRPA